jgi:UTP:GlnB (protein PII) uridylyltransferase
MAELYVDVARQSTSDRIAKLRDSLAGTAELVHNKACVYATGSFGRLEAGEFSDLDVFTVIDVAEKENGEVQHLLSGVDHTKLKYHLIQVAEDNHIPKFDADGKYLLASHPISDFTKWLGSDEDDYRNTLTARMLMLLESKCLVGDETYNKAIKQVIEKYFRYFKNHENGFRSCVPFE